MFDCPAQGSSAYGLISVEPKMVARRRGEGTGDLYDKDELAKVALKNVIYYILYYNVITVTILKQKTIL